VSKVKVTAVKQTSVQLKNYWSENAGTYNNNNNGFICIAARMLDYTHYICHAGQYVYAVQHGNASSHTWNTAIQGR